jgi:ATP-dependent DNA helicase RecQ
MCTLWQRLGRAARALHLTAIGLFFVEPKRFDANIARAEARAVKKSAASKKRKQTVDPAGQPAAKRAAVAIADAPDLPVSHPIPPAAVTEEAVDPADPGDVPDLSTSPDLLPSLPKITLDQYRADRRAVYDAVVAHQPVWKKQTKKKGADRLEPALDDLINAPTRQPGEPCYREPVMIFFGNDNTSK